MSAAAGVYQSVVGFLIVLITNLLLRKISPEDSLFFRRCEMKRMKVNKSALVAHMVLICFVLFLYSSYVVAGNVFSVG